MKLQMPFRQKVGVASVFLLGIFVNVASVLRIYFAIHRSSSGDSTWGLIRSVIAATFETGLGLVRELLPRTGRLLLIDSY